jgi:hypothetical protein
MTNVDEDGDDKMKKNSWTPEVRDVPRASPRAPSRRFPAAVITDCVTPRVPRGAEEKRRAFASSASPDVARPPLRARFVSSNSRTRVLITIPPRRCSQEDERLRERIAAHGPGNWSAVAAFLEGRSSKSCRLRWCNQLNPDVKRGPFTAEEDKLILAAHAMHGNKWAIISRSIPGRCDDRSGRARRRGGSPQIPRSDTR